MDNAVSSLCLVIKGFLFHVLLQLLYFTSYYTLLGGETKVIGLMVVCSCLENLFKWAPEKVQSIEGKKPNNPHKELLLGILSKCFSKNLMLL